MSEGRPSDTAFHVAAARASLTSRQHALLLGAALLALALRCLHLWGQARNNPLYEILMMDPLVHHEWAQRIAAGEGMGEEPYFRAPLYYYALGGLYALTGFGHTAARLFGCALGALTCYLVGRLGAELEDFRTGLLAAVLAGFYWPLIYFDNELVSVCLENTLNAGALLSLIVAGRRRSPRLFLLGGLLWGASAVTRPSVLVLAPAFALWTWIAATPPGRVRSALFSAALVGAGAALVIAPVTARNVIVGGEHVAIATNGGVNFYIGNNPRSNGFSAVVPGAAGTIRGVYEDSHHLAEADVGHRLTRSESSRYWLERSIDWIRSEPDAFAAHLLRKLRYLLAPVEVPNNQPILFFTRYSEVSAVYWLGFPILFCLAAAGLVLAASDWRRWFLPFAFVALHAATVVMFFAAARFRAPLAPVLCVAAATVVWRAPGLLAARSWKRLAAAGGAALLAVASLVTFPIDLGEMRDADEGHGYYLLGVNAFLPPPGTEPDLAAAASHLLRAVELRPRDAFRTPAVEVLHRIGVEQIQRGEPRAAIDVLERVVELAPDRAHSFDALAGAQAKAGDWERAVASAERGLGVARAAGNAAVEKRLERRLREYRLAAQGG